MLFRQERARCNKYTLARQCKKSSFCFPALIFSVQKCASFAECLPLAILSIPSFTDVSPPLHNLVHIGMCDMMRVIPRARQHSERTLTCKFDIKKQIQYFKSTKNLDIYIARRQIILESYPQRREINVIIRPDYMAYLISNTRGSWGISVFFGGTLLLHLQQLLARFVLASWFERIYLTEESTASGCTPTWHLIIGEKHVTETVHLSSWLHRS